MESILLALLERIFTAIGSTDFWEVIPYPVQKTRVVPSWGLISVRVGRWDYCWTGTRPYPID